MHIIQVTAVYKGVRTHPEQGFEFLHFEIPPTTEGTFTTSRVPLCILPSQPAKNTTALDQKIFEEGTKLLIEGRLYPDKNGRGPMYIQPTKELQIVNQELVLNQVTIIGNTNWSKSTEYGFEFNINAMLDCQEKRLGYNSFDDYEHKPCFWLSAKYDAEKKLKEQLYKGRQVLIGGKLTFKEYTNKKTGNKESGYVIKVNARQHNALGFRTRLSKEQWSEIYKLIKSFGSNDQGSYKPKEREAFDSPHQQAIAKPSIPETDDIPF